METPIAIKRWLNSEQMSTAYLELAEKFGINASALTLVIYYLESKKISPADFVTELQNNIGKEVPPELIKQIINRALEPIRNDLLNFGINISLIKIPSNTVPSPAISPDDLPKLEVKQSIEPQPTVAPIPKVPTSTTTQIPEAKPAPTTPSPYILHQEAAFKTLSQEHNINYEPIRQAFFSSNQSSSPAFKPPLAPAKIQFGSHKEAPAEKKTAPTKTEAFTPRIIHYSALSTPINPFNKEVSFSQPLASPAEIPLAAPRSAIVVPPTKFNDRIIENVSRKPTSPTEATENRKIDLKDLPL
jgi:hypothetical protein